MNAQMLKSDSRYIQHEYLESESLAPSVGLLGAKGADILGFNLANGRAGNESFVVWSLIMLGAHGFMCTRIIIPMTNPARPWYPSHGPLRIRGFLSCPGRRGAVSVRLHLTIYN